MNSFWNHLKSAARLGAKVCVLSLPGIMNDLDTLEDIKRIAMTKINSGISEKIRRIWKQRME
jgi:2-phospho-L-lactate guanylyltransferase (CobY/MobA/RfbA family)